MNNKQLSNIQDYDVLYTLNCKSYTNQRVLAEESGHSLGVVNNSIKNLIKSGYLDDDANLTKKARDLFNESRPSNAIILAAGYGMRMAPINTEIPKALLEVNGETLIERLIKQLHEVGIFNITIVVGFMKDSLEFLIDDYGVELKYNNLYGVKNNLTSLNIVRDRISNTYIIPCDIWCEHNPFRKYELYSWYMVSDLVEDESDVRVNRKMELVRAKKEAGGNAMVGVSYITAKDSSIVKQNLETYASDSFFDDKFWEEALYEHDKMTLRARVVHASEVVEINTYEQLRDLDSDSNQLKSEVLSVIAKELAADPKDVVDILTLKKGMTNRSFMFSCKGKRYIMRVPGEGTEKLIDRASEAKVYHAISEFDFCDAPVYINPENGYKLTKYIDGVRNCDANNESDVVKAMALLKKFHDKNIEVDNSFDIFGQIQKYEDLWEGNASVYRDYKETKKNVLSLKPFIEKYRSKCCLTHIDAVSDNFLFYPETDKYGEVIGEGLQLTDWEYAGMQDPDVDLAMFSIYSFYDQKQIDKLIDIYYGSGNCELANRIKIYCYVSACGLLWSNWCEYKRRLGVEFGEYSLRQYRYAKEFYRIASRLIQENMGDESR